MFFWIAARVIQIINGELTYEKIDKIITQKMKQPSKTIKLSYKEIKDYFSADASPKEIEDVVVKAWFENENSLNNQIVNEEEIEILRPYKEFYSVRILAVRLYKYPNSIN